MRGKSEGKNYNEKRNVREYTEERHSVKKREWMERQGRESRRGGMHKHDGESWYDYKGRKKRKFGKEENKRKGREVIKEEKYEI